MNDDVNPVIPNAKLEQNLSKKLVELIDATEKAILKLIDDEGLALDEALETKLNRVRSIRKERQRILREHKKKFEQLQLDLFIDDVDAYVKRALAVSFDKVGLKVNMKLDDDTRAVLDVAVNENVKSINSFADEYQSDLEQIIERGFLNNKNIKDTVSEIKQLGKVSTRKAYLIAKDQTAKLTDTLTRHRCAQVGITEGIWVHRAGGSKSFRASHIKLNGKKFNLAEGIYDSAVGKYIHAGELPNCKCIFRPVLPFEVKKQSENKR